jgi:hypothetical protein
MKSLELEHFLILATSNQLFLLGGLTNLRKALCIVSEHEV